MPNYNGFTDARKAANARYANAGKRGDITLTMARYIRDDIAAYAESRGMTPTACVRECIQRCMALDGWESVEAKAKQAPGTARAGGNETEPPKRKRGRPRKNPAE